MGYIVNINCKLNNNGAWCKCKEIKRGLFGLGARLCIEYPPSLEYHCKHKVEHRRPELIPFNPPPAPKRIIKENFEIKGCFRLKVF